MSRIEEDTPRVLITVHGIRTFGQWQERLGRLVEEQHPNISTEHYHYGYFSVVAFLIPIFRWFATRAFRKSFLELARKHSTAEFDFVAHSFGTHLVAWGLLGIPSNSRPRVRNIILAGSVLPLEFPWRSLVDDGSVHRVVNECGTEDFVLILSQWLVLFTGMAGRLGFAGMTNRRLVNRFFQGGHSLYFLTNGKPSDEFMRQMWLPVLAANADPAPIDERQAKEGLRGGLQGAFTWLLQVSQTMKVVAYVALFAAIAYFSYFQPHLEAALTRQRFEFESQVASAYRRRSAEVARFVVFKEKELSPSTRLELLQAFDWLLGELAIFDYDKVALSPEGKAALTQVVELIHQTRFNGDILVRAEVVKYCTGPRSEDEAWTPAEPGLPVQKCTFFPATRAYALRIAERKAAAVRQYLIANGIESTRIISSVEDHTNDRAIYPVNGVAEDWNRIARQRDRFDIQLRKRE